MLPYELCGNSTPTNCIFKKIGKFGNSKCSGLLYFRREATEFPVALTAMLRTRGINNLQKQKKKLLNRKQISFLLYYTWIIKKTDKGKKGWKYKYGAIDLVLVAQYPPITDTEIMLSEL